MDTTSNPAVALPAHQANPMRRLWALPSRIRRGRSAPARPFYKQRAANSEQQDASSPAQTSTHSFANTEGSVPAVSSGLARRERSNTWYGRLPLAPLLAKALRRNTVSSNREAPARAREYQQMIGDPPEVEETGQLPSLSPRTLESPSVISRSPDAAISRAASLPPRLDVEQSEEIDSDRPDSRTAGSTMHVEQKEKGAMPEEPEDDIKAIAILYAAYAPIWEDSERG